MKPSDLEPLIGRTVSVFQDGERFGKVKDAPASNTISVEFPFGRRRVPIDHVRGVMWRGKLEPLTLWLGRRSGSVA